MKEDLVRLLTAIVLVIAAASMVQSMLSQRAFTQQVTATYNSALQQHAQVLNQIVKVLQPRQPAPVAVVPEPVEEEVDDEDNSEGV